MSIDAIHSMLPKQTEQILPGGIAAADFKGVPKSPLLGLSPQQATMVRKQPGIVRDLRCLTKLKEQIQRTRQGRGPKRRRRMRRRSLQRRYRMVHKRLMGRLRRHFNRHRHHGCHRRHHPGHNNVQGANTNQSQGASNNQGGDFSFLDDPSLSMSEKIEMFLEQCAKQTEAKMQELMEQYEDQGKSGSKNDTKRKVVGAFTKIGAAVASVYGGPAAGAAVNTAGNAINDATDSKKEGSSETDQRMTMFKIQKLQSQMDEMFQLFSKISNSDDETKKRIIANC
jgi:hypothetical protein